MPRGNRVTTHGRKSLPEPGTADALQWEEAVLAAENWVPHEMADSRWKWNLIGPYANEADNLPDYIQVNFSAPRRRLQQVSLLARDLGMTRDSLVRLLLAEFIHKRTGELRQNVLRDFPIVPIHANMSRKPRPVKPDAVR